MHRTTIVLAALLLGLALASHPAASVAQVVAPAAAPQAGPIPSRNVELSGHIGGQVRPGFVRGSLLFAGFGRELAVLDISNPTQPRRINYLVAADVIQDIASAGNYAYLAAETDLRIVDISEPGNLREVGALHGEGYVRTVAVAGAYAYIGDSVPGENQHFSLRAIDISNPSRPQAVGTLALPRIPADIAVSGSYAYLADGTVIHIIDISDPRSPRKVGEYSQSTAPWAITIAGRYAYSAEGNDTGSMSILDLANPASPTLVGSIATTGRIAQVAVNGSFAYLADYRWYGTYTGRLRVVDISNPRAPSQRGSIDTLGNAAGLVLAGGVAYVADTFSGLRVIDVAAPSAPREVGAYGAPWTVYAVDVAGGRAYVAGDGMVNILDTSNPANITQLGSYYIGQRATVIKVAGNYAYVVYWYVTSAGYASQMKILNIANPAAPALMSTITLPFSIDGPSLEIAGRYAYIAAGNLLIYDIGDPRRPKQVGTYPSPGYIYGVGIAGHYAYILDTRSDPNHSLNLLHVLDISDPRAPHELGTLEISSFSEKLAVADHRVLITAWESLQVIDVSNPAAPFESGHWNGHSRDVVTDGKYAYVGGDDLRVIDISNPRTPIEVGFHTISGYDLALDNGAIYVAGNWQAGLSILHFTGPSLTGRVADLYGRPFAGVMLALSNGQTTSTDSSGVYTFTKLLEPSYTLTPTLSGYSFYPPTRTVTLPRGSGDFTVLPAAVTANLAPGVAGTLTFSDTLGRPTELAVPAGALTDTLTLTLAPTIGQTAGGLLFAGHAFELSATPASPPIDRFGAPLALSISYSELDMRSITDEGQLTVRWWSGSAWQDAAQSCGAPAQYTRDMAANRLSLPICQLGRYALFGPTDQLYLPLAGLE